MPTHKVLIAERGAQCLFCDYRELLRQIQNTYNSQVTATELEILNPVMSAEVLVLDDLGAIRPSEWVWDTVSLMINSRYNNMRTTIITTNYPALAPGEGGIRAETLGDRIGERMRSRLVEMCRVIEMQGQDFRQSAGRQEQTNAPDRRGKGSDRGVRRAASQIPATAHSLSGTLIQTPRVIRAY